MNETASTPSADRGVVRRSRRAFIRGAGGVLAAGWLLTRRAGVERAAAAVSAPLHTYSFAAFAPHRGQRFRINPEGATPLDVRLYKVGATTFRAQRDTRGRPAATSGEHFTLVFEGPRDRPLAQGKYQFSHARLGGFELFIVPGGVTESAQRYLAVINRPVL